MRKAEIGIIIGWSITKGKIDPCHKGVNLNKT
jgi:hypothetical protein